MSKANGRVISVSQEGDIANVLLGWDRPDDAANSYVDLHNLIRLTAYGRSRTRLLRTSAAPQEFETAAFKSLTLLTGDPRKPPFVEG